MGSMMAEQPAGLSDEVYVNVIDKLREFGIADLVSLPQLVVVGDQSSGKSSVLENLTGFAFPRAPGLCTRYATQITCRRDDLEGIEISIIPRPDSDESREERLRAFKRYLSLDDLALVDVFAEANKTMGIRGVEDDPDSPELTTFSEDILKIEISGPTQQHLTVIDVPGIFRIATENLTTNDDIILVRNMVKKYIKDERTIILAVVPCNVDIATQEVLTLAKEVDPDGVRTMGVLTKPDLAPERATQQAICELVLGRRHTLRLGYYIVKNRGSDDDEECSNAARQQKAEHTFFSSSPWASLRSTQRVGIASLQMALRDLLRGITKKEFKNVTAEVDAMLQRNSVLLEKLGPARSDAAAQRRYLGLVSSEFQMTAQCAREGHFNGAEILTKRVDLRLITRIVKLNERFNDACWHSGHSRSFGGTSTRAKPSSNNEDGDSSHDETNDWPNDKDNGIDIGAFPELRGILREADYEDEEPVPDSIMEHIAAAFNNSRGPELGTFGGSVLSEIFKEQSKKWEPLVLRHTSQTIVLVHYFVTEMLKQVCPEEDVRDQLWNMVLGKKLVNAYRKAMNHAIFLLDIERNGPPYTLNHYFNNNLQEARGRRLGNSIEKHGMKGNICIFNEKERGYKAIDNSSSSIALKSDSISKIAANKSNKAHTQEDIHDILKSYYKVARKRFVDVVCQQVVFRYLLDAKDSPLRIFSPELVLELDDKQLRAIAGEDSLTRSKREQLVRDIEGLQKAADELMFGSK
ncbi:hypothetical protein ACHAQH_001147 [Verticillium albo-atrum]